ncbi:hypothetical protein ACIQ9R_20500 [Streptomyces sp. NPDC094447]|uniref:hypothetical protein n=1 Tax=Streptomyces sp. NPDC094447 TaxID=3366062 RepID=UPI0037F25016
MEAGKTARKRAETEAIQWRFDAKVDERRDLRLAHRQTVDACINGECPNRLKIGRLDLAMIAGHVLDTRVVPVIVTVCGVVLGDAIDVGELHTDILQRCPEKVPRI